VAFAQGPAEAILRIWFDEHLVYDVRDPTAVSAETPGGLIGFFVELMEVVVTKPGLRLRKYLGTETQEPCPTMQAVEGIGETPAHRGTVYITVDDYDFTEHGRPPQIKAEVAFKAGSQPDTAMTSIQDTTRNGYAPPLMVDYARNRILFMNDDATEGYGYRTHDITTFVEGEATPIADIGIPNLSSFGVNQEHRTGQWTGTIFVAGPAINQMQFNFIDPDTLTYLGHFGESSGLPGLGEHGGPDKIALSDRFTEVVILAPPQAGLIQHEQRIVMGWSTPLSFNRFFMLDFTDATNPLMLAWGGAPAAGFEDVIGAQSMPPAVAQNRIYVLNSENGTTDAKLHYYEFDYGCYYDALANRVVGARVGTEATFPASLWGDLGASGTSSVKGPLLDRTDGNLLFWAYGPDGEPTNLIVLWKYNLGTSSIQWVKRLDGSGGLWDMRAPALTTYIQSSRVDNGVIGFVGNNNAEWVLIDTIDGEVIDFDNTPGVWAGLSGEYFYDDTRRYFTGEKLGGDPALERICIGREFGLGEPLDEVVATLSGTGVNGAKLPSSQYDVTQLAGDTLRGGALTRSTTPRGYLEKTLMPVFDFDSTLVDGKVVFVKRTDTSIATIPEDDLVVRTPLMNEARTMEFDLPRRIEVKFIDKEMDYEDNSSLGQRSALPVATMLSRAEASIEYPIVLTASEAKEIAERLLHTAWSQRVTFEFTLPHEYYQHVPTNVVTLQLNNGSEFLLRIVNSEIMPGHTINVTATALDTSLAIASDATADASVTFEPQVINNSVNTRLFMFDGPYLRDVDATGRAALEVRYAMSGTLPGWVSGSIFQSPDNNIYSSIGRAIGAASYGIITNKLPSGTNTEITDENTVLTVRMIQGSLSSVSETDYYENTNVAAIGAEGTGFWENIIFRDAVQNANGTYSVSHIGRGRRGTDSEFFTEGHVNGEVFFVLDRAVMERITLPNSDLNTIFYYKGVGDSEFIENVPIRALASTGGPLKPLKPSYLTLTVDGSDNIDIAWTRSTRLNYENAQDWNTKALNEDSEEYEVDILDESGTVVRTATGLTSEAYEYTKANMITDIAVSNATATIAVGSTSTFTQATGSFITDGFVTGMKIETAAFTDGANNGIFTVSNVAALTLTVEETTLVVESGTGDETITGIRRPDWTTRVYQVSAQVGRGYASDDTLLPT
jgi:hypothetical protein